jgi:hypothetical protein
MSNLHAILFAAGVAVCAPLPAHAITAVTTETFTFTGTCSDCGAAGGAGTATAALDLENYTLGNILQTNNFESFTYTSILLGTLFVDLGEFQHFGAASELANLPGFENVAINWISGDQDYQFHSSSDGTWSVEIQSLPGDVGTNGIWSATPLPATLPLFAGGLGFVGYLAKRRRKNAAPALAA